MPDPVPPILYPSELDSNENLFVVHDALVGQLADDYNPGDTNVTVVANAEVLANFPPVGILTLTDQCNDPSLRATSFYYSSVSDGVFSGIEILPECTDVFHPAVLTDAGIQVVARHHNSIKDAILAIENFIGIEGQEATGPGGTNIVARLNFLRRLALSPRAWLKVENNSTTGLVPFEVSFTDESLEIPLYWQWDFGDGTIYPQGIGSTAIPNPVIDTAVPCGINGPPSVSYGNPTHTYTTPGIYDVTLTVANHFGEDTVVFPGLIVARTLAPNEATFSIEPTKTVINSAVYVACVDNGQQPDDPIEVYSWQLSDDLNHSSSPSTVAMYGIGGFYDVVLRTDTLLDAYRITTLPNAINVVEAYNLYLFAFDSPASYIATSKTLNTYEFGLISESFKSNVMPGLSVIRDMSFMSGYPNLSYQQSLFLRNVSFGTSDNTPSGNLGQGVLYHAQDSNTIKFDQFAPFVETWTIPAFAEDITKNWNWIGINDGYNLNILFGEDAVSGSPSGTDQAVVSINVDGASISGFAYTSDSYSNGADELMDTVGSSPLTWSSCFHVPSSLGFISRNSAVPGGFFRIQDFYQTFNTTIGNVVLNVLKLPPIPGVAKTALELVPLAAGVFVFNNSGEVSVFSPISNSWSVGGPGINTASFSALQDTTVSGFSNLSNTLLAAGDGGRNAYLSFDYSPNAFVNFNEATLSFSSLGARPTSNEQFWMTIF